MPKRCYPNPTQIYYYNIKRHKSIEHSGEGFKGSSKPYGVPIPLSIAEKNRISYNSHNSDRCLSCELSHYNYNYSILHGNIFDKVRCVCDKI